MWKIYLLEFICVAILSIMWVVLLQKEKREKEKEKDRNTKTP
jgi:hypothetical protein